MNMQIVLALSDVHISIGVREDMLLSVSLFFPPKLHVARLSP